jgi:hypothetical protein
VFDQRDVGMKNVFVWRVQVFQALSNPPQQRRRHLGMLSANAVAHPGAFS